MRPSLPLADAVLQQFTWWWAVVLAARGEPALAAAGGAAALLAHLALRRRDRGRILRAAAGALAYGLASDSVLAASGLVGFAGAGSVSPAWMAALWAVFAAGLTASLARVARWPAPGIGLAAAAAGPLAYRAGAALGAIALPGGLAALSAIAVQWAIGVPLIAWLARPTDEPSRRGARVATPTGAPGAARRPRWQR